MDRPSPLICILLADILLPATARAVLHIEGRKADGRPMMVREKFEAYASSTAITTAVLLVARGAFVATCAPTACVLGGIQGGSGMNAAGPLVAYIAGGVSVLFVMYQLGRRLWPRKD